MKLPTSYDILVERLAILDRHIELRRARLLGGEQSSGDLAPDGHPSLEALLASRATCASRLARMQSHEFDGLELIPQIASLHTGLHTSSDEFSVVPLLLRVADVCASGDYPVEQCLRAVLDAAIELTGAAKGNIQVLDGASGKLRIEVSKGFERPFLDFFEVVSIGEASACSEAMTGVNRVIVSDVCSSPIFVGSPSLETLLDAGVRAVTSVPLVVRAGQVVGMLSIHFSAPHAPDERTLSFIEMLGRVAADYLQRVRAHRELEAAAQQFGESFASAAVGLTRCSRDLRYVAANQTYAAIVGLPVARIVGREIADVLGTEALERIRPRIERVLSGERVEYEEEIPFALLGPKWSHVVYAPWKEHGDVVGWLASVSDVSTQHRAEEELRLADQRKDELLATLGHELRSPLGAIRNGVHLLRSTGIANPAPVVDVIERQANQLGSLINEMIDVSRLNHGAIELQREPTELVRVLRAALETAGPALQASGCRLELVAPHGPLHVDGDALRLSQVFVNLLDNAAKYSDPGGRIDIVVSRDSGDAVVCVRDRGIGIAAEMLPHVFELFAQEAETGRRHRGLGIGLALVKRMVALHGGRVEARSDGRGQGSEFEVRLPLTEAS